MSRTITPIDRARFFNALSGINYPPAATAAPTPPDPPIPPGPPAMTITGTVPPTNLPRALLTTGYSPGDTITFVGEFLVWNALPPVVSGLILDFSSATFHGLVTLATWPLAATLVGGHFLGGVQVTSSTNITIQDSLHTGGSTIKLRGGSHITVLDNTLKGASSLYVDQVSHFSLIGNQTLEPKNDGYFINASQHGLISRNVFYSPSRLTTSHPDGLQLTNQLGPGFDCDDIDIIENILIGAQSQGQYSKEQHARNIRLTRNYIRVGYKWAAGFWGADNITFTENDMGTFDPSSTSRVAIDFRQALSPPIWEGRGNLMNGAPLAASDFQFT